jgi:hypothetical protein
MHSGIVDSGEESRVAAARQAQPIWAGTMPTFAACWLRRTVGSSNTVTAVYAADMRLSPRDDPDARQRLSHGAARELVHEHLSLVAQQPGELEREYACPLLGQLWPAIADHRDAGHLGLRVIHEEPVWQQHTSPPWLHG